MIGKGTKLYSILFWKCAKCHKGDLFKTRNAYSFSNIDKMHERCPNCNENYMPEPGFYYGAMYVSYALSIALSVSVFVAMTVLWTFDITYYLMANAAALLIVFPWMFRTSRAMWLNFFVHFNPNVEQKPASGSLLSKER